MPQSTDKNLLTIIPMIHDVLRYFITSPILKTYSVFSFRTHVRLLVLKFICHQPFFSQVKLKSNSLLPQKPIFWRWYVHTWRDLLGRFLLLESVFQSVQATIHKFICIYLCINMMYVFHRYMYRISYYTWK